ncbi:hypothetical protein HMPREF9622_00781 [Cutibacterium modestum HL037PA3]|uniref:Uncharacterized protein n=1 Tax=Cutibacterium modestum HL044PA1 TaxID=765109 RepID=A0ABP2K4P3_9ACTN|nr:hypothetical protein HMPREF9621_00393 [Cutibacterium modestum HL037PA2]EFS91748.1 hypothetical protein HMPREF9607_02259 [Cutibacterium modestum HL044PA1]EFT15925.1 hypothetical protein HMPREF9622_00781 [Cutibacterium modestum HL037PA3]
MNVRKTIYTIIVVFPAVFCLYYTSRIRTAQFGLPMVFSGF